MIVFRNFGTENEPSTVKVHQGLDPALSHEKDRFYKTDSVNAMVGHNFPDFIEWWNRDNFRKVGYGLWAVTAAATTTGGISVAASGAALSSLVPGLVLGTLTAGYWHLGLQDIRQTSHAIRRNYPVLGNMRYILETVRLLLFELACDILFLNCWNIESINTSDSSRTSTIYSRI